MSSTDIKSGDLSPEEEEEEEEEETLRRWKERAAKQPSEISSEEASKWGITPDIKKQRQKDSQSGPVKGIDYK